MAAITTTDLTAAYKELYDGQVVQELVFDEWSRPFLSRVNKKTDFEGEFWPCPVEYADVGGGSITFAKAQANVAAMKLAVFQIDVLDFHRVVQIKVKALRKARSNLGTFISQQKIKTDSALRALANDLEKAMYRSCTGWLGRIGSFAASVVTFLTDGEAKNFCQGDVLVCASGLDQALRNGGATATITVVDYENNQITVSGTTTGWTGNDYLFREGDYTAANDKKRLHGLDDWIPSSAPSATAFLGVDRSVAPQALGGIRATGSLSDIEADILSAATKQADWMGGKPDVMLCSFTLWRLLAKELGYTVRRKPEEGKGGFERLVIVGPNGPIEILPSTFCQTYTSWLLEMETWKLVTAGETAGIFDDDGNLILRIYNDDALEVRAVSYPELACTSPGKNTRITWS